MPITVVVGGQFGSEGKGKVASALVEESGATIAIRCGGSNSGHTVYSSDKKKYVFRQLPTACLQEGITNVLVPGSYIDVSILQNEIRISQIDPKLVCIDPLAVVVTEDHISQEKSSGLIAGIGSTGSGTGNAVCQRISRTGTMKFAKDAPELANYICDTKRLVRSALDKGQRIVIEGTQGFGLSVLHSTHYPYVTSRDTTAGGFISECGFSPLDVDEVVLVIRTFPIRVSGNSGPLPSEINWNIVSEESGTNSEICEYTSVTNQVRRVARFDADIVKDAILANNPTRIVLNHLDYVRKDERKLFVDKIEKAIGRKIDFLGESPFGIEKNMYQEDSHLYLAKI